MSSNPPSDEVKSLTAQISFLDEEIAVLRRRLQDTPRQVRSLEDRLHETESSLVGVTEQNERLAATMREARDQIIALKEEVDRLAQPPSGYGLFLSANEDDTCDVFTGGRKMRVNVSPNVEPSSLRPGQEVVLNEALNIVAAMSYETLGEVVMLRELFPDKRRALVISSSGDGERVVQLAEPLAKQPLRAGDSLLLEPRSGYVYERVPKSEVEALVLEEVPDISYWDIGGLSRQIEQIRDAIELPYLYAESYKKIQLRAPKGVLLYGPPGCGKTLIAKAVASSLAKQVAAQASVNGIEETSAGPRQGEGKSFFLSIKGPELLNKYVGETERHIRLIFQRAREKAGEGMPVIVFFDEMDAIFRTRGTGVSTDIENTIVTQLLSEIDGVEGLGNVIVIGATNREDMIDPAILRPGRLDVKIKIERPDATAARDILSKYLLPTLPIHSSDLAACQGDARVAISNMIDRTIDYIYSDEEHNQFLEVTFRSGEKETIYFRDFCSGAILANIVAKAKETAIKRFRDEGTLALRVRDLIHAAAREIAEIEDLSATTNPDDFARISGRKGEDIQFIRTLSRRGSEFSGRSIYVR
jgi:proteasome-associated ATPase